MPIIRIICSWRHGRPGVVEVASGRWEAALCGAGGPKVPSPPPPDPAQIAAQQSQAAVNQENLRLVRQQSALNEQLLPFELQHQGLQQVPDPKDPTKMIITRMTPEQILALKTPTERLQDQVTQAANAKVLAGLSGTIPLPADVATDWNTAEQQLKTKLAQQFGPGYESSTGGARALAEFQRQKAATEASVQTGLMTSADAVGTRAQLSVLQKQSQVLGQLQGTVNPLATTSAALSGVANNFGQQAAQLEQQRQFNSGLMMQAASNSAGLFGSGIAGGLGAVGRIGAALLL